MGLYIFRGFCISLIFLLQVDFTLTKQTDEASSIQSPEATTSIRW